MKKAGDRTHHFLLSIVIVFIPVFVDAEDRRIDKSFLTIMTLNAEFLWDGVAPEEGSADFPWKHSQSEAEEHMRKLSEIIIKSDPDIVNLVEVENEHALAAFNVKFLPGRGYRPYFIKGKDNSTGQDVVLLTRIDPEDERIFRDDRKGRAGDVSKSVSKNYYTTMKIDDTKIALIGLHFLAFPQREDRRLQREAQADVIRSLALEQLNRGYQVVIMGDFNDYDAEVRDHTDNMPVSKVLSSLKEMDAASLNDDLVNAAFYAPKTNRYTAFWDANRNDIVDYPDELTSIDHILLSPELAARIEIVEFPHDHDPRLVTDHYPVVVRLKLAAITPPAPAGAARISGLLPNPEGDENQNEEVAIRNTGPQLLNMMNWKLRDLSGKTWSLDNLGTIKPGQEKTIKRKGQAMSLNNTGDTIDLINPDGKVIHTATYGRVEEGELVTPAMN